MGLLYGERLRVDDYTNIRWSGQMMLPMMINIEVPGSTFISIPQL